VTILIIDSDGEVVGRVARETIEATAEPLKALLAGYEKEGAPICGSISYLLPHHSLSLYSSMVGLCRAATKTLAAIWIWTPVRSIRAPYAPNSTTRAPRSAKAGKAPSRRR